MLTKLEAERVVLKTDSQLVAQQVLGNYEANEDRMKNYNRRIKDLTKGFIQFEIIQIPRKENSRVDFLARTANSVEGSWDGRITLTRKEKESKQQNVAAITEEGTDWRTPIIHYLQTGEKLNKDAPRRSPYGKYYLIKGRLFKRALSHPLLRCLRKVETVYALHKVHNGRARNHAGYKDLVRKIVRAGFYWPTMTKEAKAHVRKCQSCQKNAPRIHTPAERMWAMYSAYPFDKWGIDIVGKLPLARGDRTHLIVAVDYFSNWVEAEAVPKIDDVTMGRFIWRNICCRYGPPRILVSDNGTQFSERIRYFYDRMDITQRFISMAHPQANGQVEMTNRTICDGIQKRL